MNPRSQALRLAATALFRGRCYRLVSPGALSTSISCDELQGWKKQRYMLGHCLLVPTWSGKWSLYLQLEAIFLSRAWSLTTQAGAQYTDLHCTERLSAAYFFAFGFKPRFCAWIMWRMLFGLSGFLYLVVHEWYVQNGCLTVEIAPFVCLETDTSMSRIPDSRLLAMFSLLLLKCWRLQILYSHSFIKMFSTILEAGWFLFLYQNKV